MPITALDLFAGSGWGVACKRLGIEEMGVELMPEAIETRRLNGMATVYEDVWDGLLLSQEEHEMLYGEYDVLIASPPCQTFSLAGKGAGRQALNEVLEAVQLHAYKTPAELLAFGEKHDLRTALVLSPLAYVYRDRPRYVVLEQVPTVLPVWEEYAKVMADWGYDVKTEVLNAEQYGVPQTRRRAILVASLDGPAMLPVPSHSRYYSRNPEKLDPGVLKWVSMAEALGWGAKDQPCHTVTGGVHGPTDRWASGGASVRKALDAKIGGPEWVPRTGLPQVEGRTEYVNRFDVAEVAAIQTYPVFRNGNQANAARRPLDAPAPTVHFGARSNKVEWMDPEAALDPAASGELVTVDQAAALQTYPAELRPEIESWKWKDAPATTVAGDPRITAREHHYHGEQSKTSLRLTQPEAVTLQTFPEEPPFRFAGTKSKQFLQIGNAVPPLLGQRILEAQVIAGELI